MEVFLILVWFLAGTATGWVLTSLRAARTVAGARLQMRSEIRHWQSETERFKVTADRHAREKAAWAAGARQGRDDVITIMPMLLAAHHHPPAQDRGTPATQMNNRA